MAPEVGGVGWRVEGWRGGWEVVFKRIGEGWVGREEVAEGLNHCGTSENIAGRYY